MVVCPDCGKEVTDAKFCSNCGSLLPKADEVASPEVEEKVDVPVEEDAAEEVQEEVVEEDAAEETVEEVVEEDATEEEQGVVVEEDATEDSIEEEPAEEEVAEEEPASEEDESEINVVKKSKFCSNCGTEVAVGTVFCPQCGSKLTEEEGPKTKFCSNCGETIDINAEICPHCGVRVSAPRATGEKNVIVSALLSIIFPGLGHFYLDLNTKAISFIIAYIVSLVLIMLIIGFILVFVVWIWALIDVVKCTDAINRGEYVEDKLF